MIRHREETMLLLYKITQLAAIAVFATFISDHRKKPFTVPLINTKVTALTKLCYPIPILAWVYAIVTASSLSAADWLSFVVSLSGIALTVKAKSGLGESHMWAGYYRPDAARVTRGPYRFLRHPMYSGIVAVIVAGSIFMWFRLPPWLVALTMLINTWIVVFLVVIAHRETSAISERKLHPMILGDRKIRHNQETRTQQLAAGKMAETACDRGTRMTSRLLGAGKNMRGDGMSTKSRMAVAGQILIVASIATLMLSLSGCGRLFACLEDPRHIDNPAYSGTRYSLRDIGDKENFPEASLIWVVDLPFTLVLDTIILPYDLVTWQPPY
jgi:uncharacterized protein YceK/protein-S-isoprenylcysteine O-methyltransferase Ste14